MFENILKNVGLKIDLTDSEKEKFTSLLDYKFIPKKTMLLQEGEICQFEFYLQKGCVRTYYIDNNGFEVTLQFGVEDWWISDIASFHEQKPSKLFIETLEDSDMFMLSVKAKEELLKEIPKFERLFRTLVQRKLCAIQNRLIDTISKTAQERYLDFLGLYPNIPQRVAQHYIASYLGISPEFVSKIRKRIHNS